jgi:hypothetical protein
MMACWKGTKPCGCVTFLYDDSYDPPRTREKELKEQLQRGVRLERITTPVEHQAARAAWNHCPHGESLNAADARAEARRLLAEATS